MTFNFKKAAAACTAVICATSMCGCAQDSGYIGTVEGLDVRNGLYLSCMMKAYDNGLTEVQDAKEALGDTSEVTDVFSQTIDGKTASEWIKAETLEHLKRYIAIEKLFNEKGLELSNDEISKISNDISSAWDSAEVDYYGIGYMIPVSQIYGEEFKTLGEYYEYIGISEETLKESKLNMVKEDMLFMALYDTDGEFAVTVEEYNTYLTENYAAVKYIELPFDDMYGLNLDPEKDAEEIQAIKDKAQSYVDRLNNGESFIEIQYEHDLEVAQNEAAVEAEESFEETTEDFTEEDINKAVEEAIANATAEKAENEDDIETVISKDSSPLKEDLTEYIWNLPADNKATIFENKDTIYVVVRDDVTANETWTSGDNRENVLHKIKDDAFDEYIKSVYAAYKVELDEKLVAKYAPEKYRGFEQV